MCSPGRPSPSPSQRFCAPPLHPHPRRQRNSALASSSAWLPFREEARTKARVDGRAERPRARSVFSFVSHRAVWVSSRLCYRTVCWGGSGALPEEGVRRASGGTRAAAHRKPEAEGCNPGWCSGGGPQARRAPRGDEYGGRTPPRRERRGVATAAAVLFWGQNRTGAVYHYFVISLHAFFVGCTVCCQW